jgi:hypothetical protein
LELRTERLTGRDGFKLHRERWWFGKTFNAESENLPAKSVVIESAAEGVAVVIEIE